MDYWSIVLSFIAGALALVYYIYRYGTYFEGTGIPYAKPFPVVGNFGAAILQRESMADIINRIYYLHPDAKYVGMYDISVPAVMLRDLELIKSVGVKNFDHFVNHRGIVDDIRDPLFARNLLSLKDDKWRDARNLLSPAFTSNKMRSMFHLMFECAKNFVDVLTKLPPEERVINIKEIFSRYTNDVIATCAFGISVDSMRNPNNDFYVLGKEATNFTGILRTIKFLIMRGLPKLAGLLNFKIVMDKAAKFFTSIVESTIKTRDERGITRPDMIQLMMESRGKRGPDKELTTVDMTAQAFIFFFAGFDTTSSLMSFAAYEIAVHPDVHAKLQAEVDEVLREANGEVTYEAINSMEYLEAVINESLRMYPVFVFLNRECKEDFELPPALPGLKPFVMKKGMVCFIPAYALQRDPKYFENPQTFDPERFLGENKQNMVNSPFLSFGIGPRMCIGNRFAMLETKVVLFHLLARCNLKPCSKTPIPMVLSKKGLALLAEGGFWLKVEPRTDSPYNNIVKD